MKRRDIIQKALYGAAAIPFISSANSSQATNMLEDGWQPLFKIDSNASGFNSIIQYALDCRSMPRRIYSCDPKKEHELKYERISHQISFPLDQYNKKLFYCLDHAQKMIFNGIKHKENVKFIQCLENLNLIDHNQNFMEYMENIKEHYVDHKTYLEWWKDFNDELKTLYSYDEYLKYGEFVCVFMSQQPLLKSRGLHP